MIKSENIGVAVPTVLLPKTRLYEWAVIACDQYSSQKEYWQNARKIVGNAPSTLELIMPEAYLGEPDEAERIKRIKQRMCEYLSDGTLCAMPEGFVLVSRTVGGRQRTGLVIALDLEKYDYSIGSKTLIRATEGTIVDRIPPRIRIREGAPIELPHIIVLIDDPQRTVIEPLKKAKLDELYSTELMLGGGHIKAWHVNDEGLISETLDALNRLCDPEEFAQKYGEGHEPLLFALGDGNHSFATAKAAWEKLKPGLTDEERENHPARYALAEIENVHDEAIVFEPIHRLLLCEDVEQALARLHEIFKGQNSDVSRVCFNTEPELEAYIKNADEGAHILPYYTCEGFGVFKIPRPSHKLCVGSLQFALDCLDECIIDYIHGKDALVELAGKSGAIGFLLPAMKKSELFAAVIYDGALPRKTFSMGEANEKRYYMECRRITPPDERM